MALVRVKAAVVVVVVCCCSKVEVKVGNPLCAKRSKLFSLHNTQECHAGKFMSAEIVGVFSF